VHFATGRRHLPRVELGHPYITACWNGSGQLPIAQNCTNTIMFPSDTTDVAAALRPVLQFSTITGFM
jgi:hypothetical protein